MTRNQNLRAVYGFVSVAIIALDQWTKKLILDNLHPYTDHITVIENWFRIVHYRNTGAAFGMGAGSGGSLIPNLLTLLAIGVFGFIIVYIFRSKPEDRLLQLGLHLVAGGAVGNLIDRFRLGSVVDFLEVFVVLDSGRKAWPAFNVADSAICVGIGLLFLDMLVAPRRNSEPNTAASPDSV